MGRQFNYYITPQQSEDFLKYAFEKGFILFVCHAEQKDGKTILDKDIQKVEYYKTIEEFWKVQELHKSFVYLYREEYGELVPKENGNWDQMRSPYIEDQRNTINKYGLTRGRIYLPTFYTEEKEAIDIIMKDFQKLVQAMRKKVKYSNYTFTDGRKTNWAISEEAVNLCESGCGLYM